MSKIINEPLYTSSSEKTIKRVVAEKTTQAIDYSTGEIKSISEEKEFFGDREPSYVKLYIDDISHLNNLSKSTNSVLYELLKYMNYENRIIIVKSIKIRIAEKLEIELQSVNNNISQLVKKHIIIREATSEYMFNPNLFGKGSWKENRELRKSLQLNISYNSNTNERNLKIKEVNND